MTVIFRSQSIEIWSVPRAHQLLRYK